MPTKRKPHSGSLQYRPRIRSARAYPRVHTPTFSKESKVSGFAGYKVGMTHVVVKDPRKKSLHKQPIVFSATIVECPPLRVIGITVFAHTEKGLQPVSSLYTTGTKELSRKLSVSKKKPSFDILEKQQLVDVRIQVQTQPTLAGFGKKKPEIFELALSGNDAQEKLTHAKDLFGKDITLQDVFREGEFVDVHAVTKGKGFQGPVRRFGVSLRSHKSEKTIRGPGNLGPWTGNRSWTVAHAGQTGMHTRTERNKWLIKISSNPKEINADGGFLRYGEVKSSFLLLKGSLPGASKRLLRFSFAALPSTKFSTETPTISAISTRSKQ